MQQVGRSVILLVLAGAPARADDEQALSVSATFATYSAPGEAMDGMEPESVTPTGGFALAGSYERAIGTDVALRAELAAGMFFGGAQTPEQGSRSYAVLGDAGAAFRFDVFKYVPYAFAGLGGVYAGGGPLDRGASFVLVAGLGCDMLLRRERSVGVELRLASFGGDITVFTAGIRGTTRWGFF